MDRDRAISDLAARLERYVAITEGLKKQWPFWRTAAGNTMAFRDGVAAAMKDELERLKVAS